MTSETASFVALLAVLDERQRLHDGLPKLRALYGDLLRAAAPPNPQFERERIIVQAERPRELLFLLGLLSEGENETALLLELAAAVVGADPAAPVAHLADEAWYYLRTSIDVNWQLDDGQPSLGAALAYLFIVLSERLATLRSMAPPVALAAEADPRRAALLRLLRDEIG